MALSVTATRRSIQVLVPAEQERARAGSPVCVVAEVAPDFETRQQLVAKRLLELHITAPHPCFSVAIKSLGKIGDKSGGKIGELPLVMFHVQEERR